jgi:hypothetical protein
VIAASRSGQAQIGHASQYSFGLEFPSHTKVPVSAIGNGVQESEHWVNITDSSHPFNQGYLVRPLKLARLSSLLDTQFCQEFFVG